jgi:hypothetical protein
MMKRRASITAMAIINSASPPPATPRASGSRSRLAARPAAPARTIVTSSKVLAAASLREIRMDHRANIPEPRCAARSGSGRPRI